MVKAVLAIPWRETPDRLKAYNCVRPRLEQMYPWEAVITGDSGHDPFRRGATRNLLVCEAQRLGADIVVLCDADSLPEQMSLVAAINMAHDGKIHYPFHEAWYMEQKVYPRLEAGQNLEQLKSRIIDKCASQGGCWVVSPTAWWAAGGMDERLTGWGCEDRAFLAASRTMLGEPVIHSGILLCMPHDRDPKTWLPEDVKILVEHHDRYLDPERMKRYFESRTDISSPIEGQAEESQRASGDV